MKRRGWAACGLMMVGITACGSSSSSKVTQTQWLAKANSVCTSLNAQTRALGPHPTPLPGETTAHTLQRSAVYLDRLVPLQVTAVTRLRALGSPPHNAQLVTQALAAIDVLNADLKDALAASHANNPKAYLGIIRGRVNGPDGNRASATAQQAGLTACANG